MQRKDDNRFTVPNSTDWDCGRFAYGAGLALGDSPHVGDGRAARDWEDGFADAANDARLMRILISDPRGEAPEYVECAAERDEREDHERTSKFNR